MYNHVRRRSVASVDSVPPPPYENSRAMDSTPAAHKGHDHSFSFSAFFNETKTQPLFNEKPPPARYSVNNSPLVQEQDRKRLEEAVQKTNQPLWKSLPAWVPIVVWIATSSFVILQNKHILSGLKFSHPIALTTIHLLFATVATRLLRQYTSLIDGAKELEATGKMTREVFVRKIVPIGVLFSASLVTSNWVYLRLSVSFIQMIKAFTPVSVLLISFILKIKEPSQKLLGIVLLISTGVAIASYGEVEFELIGFLVQCLAIVVESGRLVLIQVLLQGVGMNPLTSLYYFAPVCLIINSAILLPIEGLQPFYDAVDLVGIPTLLGNACATFALNLSSVWLIGKASGLVLTLAGVVKDILLITGSWAVMGSTITLVQCFGYAIALAGLVAFKLQS